MNRLIGVAAALLTVTVLPLAAVAQTAPAPTAPDQAPAVRLKPPASADLDATELAKKLQNPVGDLYSFPFQGNTNFSSGTKGGTQEVVNIQPVIPIHLNEDFTLITRTILPLVWQPSFQPGHTVPFGTAPINFSALLSNANPIDHWVFGVGPITQVPTASNKTLGSNVWGAGPEAVAVYINGPWVAGLLANNVWSLGGTKGPGGTAYSHFLIEPFANYNFGGGWYVTSAPEFTANWPRQILEWLLPVSLATTNLLTVATALLDELRQRRIVVPGPSIIEHLVAASLASAERHVANQLTGVWIGAGSRRRSM